MALKQTVNEAVNLQRCKCSRSLNYSFVRFTLSNYCVIVHFSGLDEEHRPFLEDRQTGASPQPQNQHDSDNSKKKNKRLKIVFSASVKEQRHNKTKQKVSFEFLIENFSCTDSHYSSLESLVYSSWQRWNASGLCLKSLLHLCTTLWVQHFVLLFYDLQSNTGNAQREDRLNRGTSIQLGEAENHVHFNAVT